MLRRIVAVALFVVAPVSALAIEAPHLTSQGCGACHMGHNAQGASLTSLVATSLCDSCHISPSSFQGDGSDGLPFGTADQAQAGVSGTSHSWTGLATNSTLGTTAPDPNSADTVISAMGRHLDGTKLKCTTCHDVHDADGNSGTAHASKGWATNIPTTAGSGTGTLQLTAVLPGAKPAAYWIKYVATNQFKISHDPGLSPSSTSWWGYSTTLGWGTPDTGNFAAGKTFATAPVTLDDGKTTVTFSSGTYSTNQAWTKFYVSFPFLRGDPGRMCVSCHKTRNMTYTNVEGTGSLPGGGTITLGSTVFSHPVNQPLNVNAGNYDRSAILDADGGSQTPTGDGNTSNDLVTNSAGNVTCVSCHHVHNADSSSVTTDPR